MLHNLLVIVLMSSFFHATVFCSDAKLDTPEQGADLAATDATDHVTDAVDPGPAGAGGGGATASAGAPAASDALTLETARDLWDKLDLSGDNRVKKKERVALRGFLERSLTEGGSNKKECEAWIFDAPEKFINLVANHQKAVPNLVSYKKYADDLVYINKIINQSGTLRRHEQLDFTSYDSFLTKANKHNPLIAIKMRQMPGFFIGMHKEMFFVPIKGVEQEVRAAHESRVPQSEYFERLKKVLLCGDEACLPLKDMLSLVSVKGFDLNQVVYDHIAFRQALRPDFVDYARKHLQSLFERICNHYYWDRRTIQGYAADLLEYNRCAKEIAQWDALLRGKGLLNTPEFEIIVMPQAVPKISDIETLTKLYAAANSDEPVGGKTFAEKVLVHVQFLSADDDIPSLLEKCQSILSQLNEGNKTFISDHIQKILSANMSSQHRSADWTEIIELLKSSLGSDLPVLGQMQSRTADFFKIQAEQEAARKESQERRKAQQEIESKLAALTFNDLGTTELPWQKVLQTNSQTLEGRRYLQLIKSASHTSLRTKLFFDSFIGYAGSVFSQAFWTDSVMSNVLTYLTAVPWGSQPLSNGNWALVYWRLEGDFWGSSGAYVMKNSQPYLFKNSQLESILRASSSVDKKVIDDFTENIQDLTLERWRELESRIRRYSEIFTDFDRTYLQKVYNLRGRLLGGSALHVLEQPGSDPEETDSDSWSTDSDELEDEETEQTNRVTPPAPRSLVPPHFPLANPNSDLSLRKPVVVSSSADSSSQPSFMAQHKAAALSASALAIASFLITKITLSKKLKKLIARRDALLQQDSNASTTDLDTQIAQQKSKIGKLAVVFGALGGVAGGLIGHQLDNRK